MKAASTPHLPRLGIDVSKRTFDVHLCLPDNSTHTAEFTNDAQGFTRLDAWLKQRKASKLQAGLEATGSGVTILKIRQALVSVPCPAVKPNHIQWPILTDGSP